MPIRSFRVRLIAFGLIVLSASASSLGRADDAAEDRLPGREGGLPLAHLPRGSASDALILQGTSRWPLRGIGPVASSGESGGLDPMIARTLVGVLPESYVSGGDGFAEVASGAAQAPATKVTETRESDYQVDGVADRRIVTETTYDRHGRAVAWTVEDDFGADGTIDMRSTVATDFGRDSTVVSRVQEDDYGDNGSIDFRMATSTTGLDERGNPRTQTIDFDYNGDGVIDTRVLVTLDRDVHGNVVREIDDSDIGADGVVELRETITSSYDSGGLTSRLFEIDSNLDGVTDYTVRNEVSRSHGATVHETLITADYGADGLVEARYRYGFNSHDQLVSYVLEFLDPGGTLIASIVTNTTVTDQRGNPTVQRTELLSPPPTVFQATNTAWEYTPRGDPSRQVDENDFGNDGIVDSRETVTWVYEGPPHLPDARAEGRAGEIGLRWLGAAGPNPFGDATTLGFFLPQAAAAQLRVYDAGGRLVRAVAKGLLPAGEHRWAWDGRDASGRAVSSGAYVARLRVGEREISKLLLRVR